MSRRAALFAVAIIGLVACGGSDGAESSPTTAPATTSAPAGTSSTVAETTDPTPTTDAATTTVGATTTKPTVDAPTTVPGEEIVGRWAHYDVVAYEDAAIKTLIISYGFNDFSLVDGEIVDQGSFCFSEQRTDQPIQTSLSDAGTQAIRPPATPIEVEETTPLTISRPATPTPVGIRLDDPANEPLPTDPDDPRIVDDDGDGSPGVTVTIEVTPDVVGELYIARREIFAYEAELVTPDRFEGTVTDDSEQLVIGASDPVFLVESDWVQHPDPAKSPIILVRVDDTWDCDRLVAKRDALFPPTPDVDW